MIKILSYILIFIAVACNKSNSNQTLLTNSSTTLNEPGQNDKKYKTCEELVTSLVRSSNAVALKNFKNVQIRIDNITTEKIIVELFVSNDISADPSMRRIAEKPVGWIEFFPATKKLHDITTDPDNPVLLEYNSTVLENADLFLLCGFDSKSVDSDINEVKCYRVENGNYSFKDICEYNKTKDFNFIHSQIVTKFGQDDLLTKLPEKDTTYSTQATPKITYSIKKELIKIEILSEGGETTFKIYRKNGKGIIEVDKSIE